MEGSICYSFNMDTKALKLTSYETLLRCLYTIAAPDLGVSPFGKLRTCPVASMGRYSFT